MEEISPKKSVIIIKVNGLKIYQLNDGDYSNGLQKIQLYTVYQKHIKVRTQKCQKQRSEKKFQASTNIVERKLIQLPYYQTKFTFNAKKALLMIKKIMKY